MNRKPVTYRKVNYGQEILNEEGKPVVYLGGVCWMVFDEQGHKVHAFGRKWVAQQACGEAVKSFPRMIR